MHTWSGYPGAYCLTCHNEPPEESMQFCQQCVVDGIGAIEVCPLHRAWRDAVESGCPPDPALIKQFNIDYPPETS